LLCAAFLVDWIAITVSTLAAVDGYLALLDRLRRRLGKRTQHDALLDRVFIHASDGVDIFVNVAVIAMRGVLWVVEGAIDCSTRRLNLLERVKPRHAAMNPLPDTEPPGQDD
jgi:hypothetical protein